MSLHRSRLILSIRRLFGMAQEIFEFSIESVNALWQEFYRSEVVEEESNQQLNLNFDVFPDFSGKKDFSVKISPGDVWKPQHFNRLFLNALLCYETKTNKFPVWTCKRTFDQHHLFDKLMLSIAGKLIKCESSTISDLTKWLVNPRGTPKAYSDFDRKVQEYVNLQHENFIEGLFRRSPRLLFSTSSISQGVSDAKMVISKIPAVENSSYNPMSNSLKSSLLGSLALLPYDPNVFDAKLLGRLEDLEKRVRDIEDDLTFREVMGAGKRRRGGDRAYWMKLRAGGSRGPWCAPGRVVGVYADGVSKPLMDALMIVVCASQPDTLGELPRSAREQGLQSPKSLLDSPEGFVAVVSVGEAPVVLDESQLEVLRKSTSDMLVAIDSAGRVILTDSPANCRVFGITKRDSADFDESGQLQPFQGVCGIRALISHQVVELGMYCLQKSIDAVKQDQEQTNKEVERLSEQMGHFYEAFQIILKDHVLSRLSETAMDKLQHHIGRAIPSKLGTPNLDSPVSRPKAKAHSSEKTNLKPTNSPSGKTSDNNAEKSREANQVANVTARLSSAVISDSGENSPLLSPKPAAESQRTTAPTTFQSVSPRKGETTSNLLQRGLNESEPTTWMANPKVAGDGHSHTTDHRGETIKTSTTWMPNQRLASDAPSSSNGTDDPRSPSLSSPKEQPRRPWGGPWRERSRVAMEGVAEVKEPYETTVDALLDYCCQSDFTEIVSIGSNTVFEECLVLWSQLPLPDDASPEQGVLCGGVFPSWLENPIFEGYLSTVKVLRLDDNEIHPPLPQLTQFTSLEILSLSGNFHSHESTILPCSFGAFWPNLRILDISSCRLTGPLPEEFAVLQQLEVLLLNDNELTGPLPACIGALKNLEELDVSSNWFTEELPSLMSTAAWRWVRILNFSMNRFNGLVPENWSSLATQCRDLRSLDLSKNHLTRHPWFSNVTPTQTDYTRTENLPDPLRRLPAGILSLEEAFELRPDEVMVRRLTEELGFPQEVIQFLEPNKGYSVEETDAFIAEWFEKGV